MIILLEGVDGGGKSSLSEKLRAALEERGLVTEIIHRGVPERDVLDEYQHDIEDYRPGTGRAIIGDRWHFGDIVYGDLYRGFSYLGGTEGAGFRFVELFLQSRGAITCLVDSDEFTVKGRLLVRGEDYLQLEHVDHVLREYRKVYRASATGGLQGEVTGNNLDPANIIRHALFRSDLTADLAAFPSYVGARNPRVLLVGEKRGKAETPSLCAFRPTAKGNSASYLLEALPGSLWRDTGLVNAYEEENLPELLDVLAGPPVIALGRKASERLTKLGIEHAGLPHPQHMRRFHSAAKVDYGQKIFNVIGSTLKEFSWR